MKYCKARLTETKKATCFNPFRILIFFLFDTLIKHLFTMKRKCQLRYNHTVMIHFLNPFTLKSTQNKTEERFKISF